MKTLSERLSKLSIPSTESGCWIWIGADNGNGYGYMTINKKAVLAHRASWECFNGRIPSGLNVLHKCDVRSCINPNHLFLGTQKENIIDMRNKGRAYTYKAPGESNPSAKLKKEDVVNIRKLKMNGERNAVIMDLYKISKAQLLRIINRSSWKND